ncbi:MAG: PAS-domain containing protein [Burkholderiales bacterium]|nr:PAS-domain containing protein [Burkholderiales bacterium]
MPPTAADPAHGLAWRAGPLVRHPATVMVAACVLVALVWAAVLASASAGRAGAAAPDALAVAAAAIVSLALIAAGWIGWRWLDQVARVSEALDARDLPSGAAGWQARLAAIDALRESHLQLRALLDTMAEGLTLRSAPDGRLLYHNASALRILGIAPADAAGGWGVPPVGWEACDEDGRPLAPDALPTVIALRTGAPCRDRVTGLKRPDGSLMWLSWNATPLFRGGASSAYAVLTTFSDVTSLKSAVLAARESQRSIEALVDNVAGVVYRVRWGTPPRPLYVSDGMERLSGRHAQEFLAAEGVYRNEIVASAADRARLDAAVAEGIGTGGRYELEYRIRCADGALKWVLDRGRVVADEAGAPVVEGLITDITARKAVEDALLARSEQLQVILDSIDQGLTLRDAAGRMIAWNRRFLELWDLPAEAIREGITMEEVLRLLAARGEYGPGDPERHVRERLACMGGARALVYEWARPDGTVLEVQQSPTPSGGLVRVHTDVTARRRAEAALRESESRYRMLFDANPSPMLVFDAASYRILAVNQAAIDEYGYSREEFLGMTLADLRDPAEWQRVSAEIRARPEHARVVLDLRHRRKDGIEMEVVVRSHPLDLGGRRARVALMHDVTDRKRAEREIAGKNAQLEAILENMAQGVSMWDGRLRLIAWNRRYEQLFRFADGLLRPELALADVCRAMAARGDLGSEDPAGRAERLVGELSGREAHLRELTLGDGRILEVRSVPLADGGSLHTVADVTDRRRAEQAIRRKSDELESVLDNMADGVVMLDSELRLAAWNRRYCELFGIPDSAVRAGMGYAELTRYYDGGEAGEIDVEETARLRASVAQGGIAYSREIRGPRGRIVDMRSVPAPAGGTLRTYTDVTERRRAEDALRKRHELESLILSISARFMALNPEATDRAVEEALARVGTFVGADRCFVTEIEEGGRAYIRRFEWCAAGIDPAPQTRERLPVDLARAAWRPLLAGEPFRIARLDDLPPGCDGWRALLAQAGTRSMAIVPLVLGGRTVGSFGFDVVRGERTWTEDELLLFRVTADLIASALERKRATALLRFRADLEELVLAASTRLISMPPEEIDGAITGVLGLAGGFLGWDRATVVLLDSTRTYRYMTHEWCAEGIASSAPQRRRPVPVVDFAETWRRVLVGEPAQCDIEDLAPGSMLRAAWEAAGVRSSLSLPLASGGRVIGAISFDACRTARRLGGEEVRLARIIGDTVAGAIERKEAHEKLAFRLALEQLILSISTRFMNLPSGALDAALGAALGEVATFIDADRGHVDLLDATGERYTVPYQWHAPGVAPALHRTGEQPTRARYSWETLRKGEILLVHSVRDLPESAAEYRSTLEAAAIRSLLGVPMTVQGRVIGALGFDMVNGEEPWSAEALPLLRVVADIFAGAIERRRHEQALAASEAMLARTSAIARVGGWELDLSRRELHWSAEVRRILEIAPGYRPTPAAALAYFAPAARSTLNAAVRRCARHGEPFDVELSLATAAGRALWVRIQGEAVYQDGRVRALAGALHDITGRKHAERALQARIDLESLILAISTRMINLPADGLEAAVRNALRQVGEFLGVDRGYVNLLDETRTLFSTPYQWHAPGVAPAVHRQQPQPVARFAYGWNRLLRGEVLYVPCTGDLPRREAVYRAALEEAGIASMLIVPLVERGEAIGAVGFERLDAGGGWGEEVLVLMKVVADILVNAIERDRAHGQVRRLNEELEQRVRERTAQLEATNAELESFSYSVSHDLRAPLRHIEGYSRILEQEHAAGLDAQGRRFLARVRSAVERMGLLIDDLLALSRVTRADMRVEAVDLSALAAAIAQELFATAPERRHEWTIEPGLRANADRRLIMIVLQNLLGNAWKYTRNAPVSQVRFGQAEREGGRAFFIRDNGAGFDPDYAGKLFKPFQRLHGADEFEGTGIGLATVHRIVARHDGVVWAEGRPGEGATFWFRLP